MSRTTDAGDGPRGERGPSRRILLRTGFTAVVAAGTAAVLIPLHDHPQDTAPAPARGPGGGAAGASVIGPAWDSLLAKLIVTG
ncbi:hypothetical protein I3W98_37135, partial [Streptomyces cavourensis]|nr:hypothetical protein [Streptomyces cavourensis]